MKSLFSLPIRGMWISVRTSFWFVPGLMALGSVGLSILMVYLDRTLEYKLSEHFPNLLTANASGTRSILSAIAASMITVAGVTFSVTIVALSLASNQYSSRILRNFMGDTGNQLVLGVFVSVFIYSLLVLRAIRGGDDAFIPSYSLLVGIFLGIVAIGFLIFFVHHIAVMVQASTILAEIYTETSHVIQQLYPDAPPDETPPEVNPQNLNRAAAVAVLSATTGYIQDVNESALIDWAHEHSALLEMVRGIGDFISTGAPLLRIHYSQDPAENALKDLRKCFSIARARTIHQDPAFGFRQIVDIALKALSPGLNDTTTATNCLDYLGALICDLDRRHIPPQKRCKNKQLRLISCAPSFSSFIQLAFGEIRQHARDNVSIYLKLLSVCARCGDCSRNPEYRSLLWEQALHVMQTAEHEIRRPLDRNLINNELEKVANHFGKDFRQIALPEPTPRPAHLVSH